MPEQDSSGGFQAFLGCVTMPAGTEVTVFFKHAVTLEGSFQVLNPSHSLSIIVMNFVVATTKASELISPNFKQTFTGRPLSNR